MDSPRAKQEEESWRKGREEGIDMQVKVVESKENQQKK